MSSWNRPETSVFPVRVFQSKPETLHREGFGEEERAILVKMDFASNPGLFEDVHRLQQKRVLHSKIPNHFSKFRITGKAVEIRIQVMHRMSDFVDGEFFFLDKHPFWVEGFFFEEKTDFIS